MRPSLREGLEGIEAERFVGRRAELAALEEVCAAPGGGLAFVSGPAGVGKSALIAAALGRRDEGRPVTSLPPPAEAAVAELARIGAEGRPIVVIEDFDRSGLGAPFLRETVTRSLPEGAVVLVESRRPPPAGLLAGPLGSAVRQVLLAPLPRAEALALLAGHGIEGARAAAAADWAGGWPAALVLCAAQGGDPPSGGALVDRLAGDDLDSVDASTIAVAALLRAAERRSLEAVGVDDPAAALRSLERLSVCELRPEGVALHPLLRREVRARIRAESPDREREIRRRLADGLHGRARSGESWQVVELAGLIEDPTVRWGFGGGEDPELRADRPTAEDLPLLERTVVERHGESWWGWTRRWLTERPEAGVVVRDGDGALRGACIATSLRHLPEWGREDPVIGGWIDHAEASSPLGEAVLWREALTLGGDDGERERALLNATATLRSGALSPRWFYGPLDPTNEREVRFSQAMGAQHLAELDVEVDGVRLECHRIDHGPGGVIGLARDIVYAELGIPPRRPPDAVQVREALQLIRQGGDLTGSPLTSEGLSPAEQRREVRARLAAAADATFGADPEDRLLHDALRLAYLRTDADPTTAPSELNVSRATYYRRLTLATERLTEQLAEGR